ncbi:hypothetical protein HIM_06381 [Hirsutella minnesotensis 3608]|uniref:Tr-type G domain-containing protein n=1 Tax=Hirsutella minnesotensis 3608 TaxID=1043627 RepID=A0A0F7ZNQ3_9HYPO|nr:hypothetical protein HIM_06381 [Hirsutella minnesotensis 3608]
MLLAVVDSGADTITYRRGKDKSASTFGDIFDELNAERKSGKRGDLGFELTKFNVILVDPEDLPKDATPGHPPADGVILVVSAAPEDADISNWRRARELAKHVRHLGIRQMSLAINKMDSVDWSEQSFHEAVKESRILLSLAGFAANRVASVPMSGFMGDNLVEATQNCPWYKGRRLTTKGHANHRPFIV